MTEKDLRQDERLNLLPPPEGITAELTERIVNNLVSRCDSRGRRTRRTSSPSTTERLTQLWGDCSGSTAWSR